jgi:hypothetical protein
MCIQSSFLFYVITKFNAGIAISACCTCMDTGTVADLIIHLLRHVSRFGASTQPAV